MARKVTEDKYPEDEAERRFEATLRGALSAPPQPLKKKPPKEAQPEPRRKGKRKAARKSAD